MARDRKYVIPFPNGITPHVSEFEISDHDRVLSFPAEYQPAIMSALKVLARPETYKSETPSEINFSVQQGHSILASVKNYPVEPRPLYADVSAGAFYGSQIESSNDPYTGIFECLVVQGSDALSACSVNINVKTHPFDAVAGGYLIVKLRFTPLNAKAYTVTGHSCTGLISQSGFTNDGWYNFGWNDAKDVVIAVDAIHSAEWIISLPGSIVCGDI